MLHDLLHAALVLIVLAIWVPAGLFIGYAWVLGINGQTGEPVMGWPIFTLVPTVWLATLILALYLAW
jgi:hypothetical protein